LKNPIDDPIFDAFDSVQLKKAFSIADRPLLHPTNTRKLRIRQWLFSPYEVTNFSWK
jgi:hypothetical protein